ncbi:DUF4762 family protein [Chania multitudinisentens]|uniref:DUF4762 family protein n=1 Tax=Chania multitudinisentens TaxID=1639108 RepID=UPI0009006F5B|nr:DUF4762 family protein [Chania multitudinisentens]
MKKINLSEASVIVGGTAPVCTVSFEKTSPTVCMQVTTCVDKNGAVVSKASESADLVRCE